MANATTPFDLPPLPDYTLYPLPPLLPWIPDKYLQLALPVIAYWVVSGIFHLIDEYDIFPQYRLHTPVEVLKRNHATRWEVFRDVIIQQIVQTAFGFLLALLDEDATYGRKEYDIAWWGQKIRLAQRAVPVVTTAIGLNPAALATRLSASQPMVAGALTGGQYPGLTQSVLINGLPTTVPAFAPWELRLAKFIYTFGFPALQFVAAIIIVDAWQYFMHRAFHMNRWLYVTIHSRHHRLYVPYAYGALYNHPAEGFFMDTLGAGLAYLVTGMTIRQSMWFFSCSTIKTVDDHCGYSIPFDPLQLISSNNAGYHDIHHQSWGIKSNFSQPFFIFWDRMLGTMWTGDISARYEKSRRAAQQKMDQDKEAKMKALSADSLNASSTSELDESAVPQPLSTRRTTRKKASSISQQSGNWKGLKNRVNDSLPGMARNVLGVESKH